MKRLRAFCLILFSLVTVADEGRTAGGAHTVASAEIETPGLCHLETWVTLLFSGDGFFNESPACTTERIPWLEIGAAYQHYWGTTLNAPFFGPALKINFQSIDSAPLGFGLALNSGVNLKNGDLGTASTIGLLTLPITDRVRANLNAGWSYLATTEVRDALYYGGQLEIDVTAEAMLMVEVFGRAPGFPGAQFGLRYTPQGGPIDFDLLVANYFDSTSTRFVTLGATVRF